MRFFAACLLLLTAAAGHAQQPFDAATVAAVRAMPAEQALAGGGLRIVNVYRTQVLVLSEMAGRPAAEIVDRLAREVYAPHASFWDGYMGGEANFRKWAAESLLDGGHPVYARLAPLTAVRLDSLYGDAAAWLESRAGRRPQGTWYLIFGPGWTDMGGMGDGAMVVDFTRMEPDPAALAAILPHEVTHQVHGPALSRAGDPAARTVLGRIISEGFATYVATVHAEEKRTQAQALGYGDEAHAWAVAHEADLWRAAQPLLASTERADIDRVASRGQALVDGGPTAAGYFLGLRIVQAYVARHGRDSWVNLFDLPVREVLARSGYAP
jgi:hypothetical protein